MKADKFVKNRQYDSLHKIIENKYGKDKADEVFDLADEELLKIYKIYPNVPEGHKMNTDLNIFPRNASYKAMEKEFGPEEAMAFTEEHNKIEGEENGQGSIKLLQCL